jgi:ABC-type hemin transport system substrate-binding protein
MKSLLLTGILVLLAAGAQQSLAEASAEKKVRCEEQRKVCFVQHEHAITTNIHGVRSVPVWVVKRCGQVYRICMTGH